MIKTNPAYFWNSGIQSSKNCRTSAVSISYTARREGTIRICTVISNVQAAIPP